MKTYSTKAAAKLGGIRSIVSTYKADERFVNVTLDVVKANFDKFFTVEQFEEGFLPVNKDNTDYAALEVFEQSLNEYDIELIKDYGMHRCPHCKVHLGNGVQTRDNLLQSSSNNVQSIKYAKTMKFEYLCLACDTEFGPEVDHTPAPVVAPASEGLKIEKDRDEQNGIKRPSIGGFCRAIWDACDALSEANGVTPALKVVKKHAAEQNWNLVTTTIQYYTWRKFHGIEGRIAKKA